MRRRTFLIGATAAAGGLVVGYSAWSDSFARQAAEQLEGPGRHLLAGWVTIGEDDIVTVQVPHIDMGQGVHTALAMMLADEMDADWSTVRAERAPAEKAFANRFLARGWILRNVTVPAFADGLTDMAFAEAARFVNLQITGGSTAVRFTGEIGMRTVGAAARAMLVEAASRRWDVPAERLEAREGVVTDPAGGNAARFGELAGEAALLSVPSSPRLKQPSEWRIIGTSPTRFDIPAKSEGGFSYGIDLDLPGMLHVAVRVAPIHGGRLVRVDPEPARAIPGVERVIPLEGAVAVVADSWWRAEQAVRTLDPEFAGGCGEAISQGDLERLQDEALQAAGSSAHNQGDADGAIASAPRERVVEAEYRVPYLHHAAMEPINATAQFADRTLTVWAGEQDALGAKALLAEISGLNARDVILHGLPVGGSFGRRIAQSADYMRHLVPIVMEMAPRPVKLILSREQEFAQGAYRPALATRITAAIDEAGNPVAWSQRFLAGPTRNEAYALPYRIANQSLRSIDFSTHVRTGTWRAVAHTQHAFWTECFIDELARAAGRDPFEYRRDLLPEGSRERIVLETAADRAGWHDPMPEGHGRGIALHESYGTWVAEVVEASLDNRGRPKVHRVVAAVDCGGLVHPDTALQQVEGGIIMGLSAALGEEITLTDGAVVQSNFHDYAILRLADTPRIEVHFIESGAPRGGLGEPALPPVAPALANAVFAIKGRPIRTLPLRDRI